MNDHGLIILGAAVLLSLGLGASLIAGRLRVPGLLLVLSVGMILGSDATGLIHFDDYELAQQVGVIALALILFEGGLAAGLPEIRPVLGSAVGLAVVGTALTALIAGLAASLLFDLSTSEGLLLGAILSATDGAAVFAVLRGSSLRRRLARMLEGESGMNDPVAILLVIGFIEVVRDPGFGVGDFLVLFVREMGIGLAVGALVGWLAVVAFRRLRPGTTGLYPVASLSIAGMAYGGADALEGSGFLAVYLAGLALGSANIPARQNVAVFHQGLAWVAQLTMFLTLGLLVFPAQLGEIALEGTILALLLALVARPVAAAVATAFSPLDMRERLVVGWAGLRGALPVVLATFPVIEGIPDSVEFFNVVFFAVVLSTLLQGGTLDPLARRLGVTSPEPALPPPLVEVGTIRDLGADVLQVRVRPGDAAIGHRVRDLGLPREALINVLLRGGEALLPRGSTRLEAGDTLHILARTEVIQLVRDLAVRWRTGPVGPPPRPPRPVRSRPVIAVVRPWLERDGDPANPSRLNGVPVIETLAQRRDAPGAVVLLEDGRFAVTSPVLVMGARLHVMGQARRRAEIARDDAEAAWWLEVLSAVAR